MSKASDHRIKELTGWWHQTYREKKGVPYLWKPGKDFGPVKRLMAYFDRLFGPEVALGEIKAAATRFLDCGDKFEEVRGYPFCDFANNPASWIPKASDKPKIPAAQTVISRIETAGKAVERGSVRERLLLENEKKPGSLEERYVQAKLLEMRNPIAIVIFELIQERFRPEQIEKLDQRVNEKKQERFKEKAGLPLNN